jgi:hypothetical protein
MAAQPMAALRLRPCVIAVDFHHLLFAGFYRRTGLLKFCTNFTDCVAVLTKQGIESFFVAQPVGSDAGRPIERKRNLYERAALICGKHKNITHKQARSERGVL